MLSTKSLVRIAAYGGCALVATNFLLQQSFQRRVRKTTIYKDTMEAVRSNEKIIKHLGEPIREGKVSIGEYEENLRWVSVKLFGTKTKGNVRCDFVPNVEGVKPSEIFRIEIEFADRDGISYTLREGFMEENITTVTV